MKTEPGLYQKYRLSHRDGSPVDPAGAFFVFRPSKDAHARQAIAVFTRSKGDAASAECLSYKVEKTDGTPVHPNTVYFVIRLDTDRHARKALRVYADLIKDDNPALARELAGHLMDVSPGAQCTCRGLALCGHLGPEWSDNAILARKVGLL
jgi:hypothetical protein